MVSGVRGVRGVHAALGTFLPNSQESHTGELGIHAFSALLEADVVEIVDVTYTVSVDAGYDNGVRDLPRGDAR